MKKGSEQFDSEIHAMFDAIAPITKQDLDEIGRVNREILNSPAFKAGMIKDQFIHAMLEAMGNQGISQNALANRIGKSRQYINKFFQEDRRRNYTIDTMVEIMHHLGFNLNLKFESNRKQVKKKTILKHFEVENVLGWGEKPKQHTFGVGPFEKTNRIKPVKEDIKYEQFAA